MSYGGSFHYILGNLMPGKGKSEYALLKNKQSSPNAPNSHKDEYLALLKD